MVTPAFGSLGMPISQEEREDLLPQRETHRDRVEQIGGSQEVVQESRMKAMVLKEYTVSWI
jgi:hypothetical protein